MHQQSAVYAGKRSRQKRAARSRAFLILLFIPVEFCELALCQQLRISPLSEHLIYADCDGIGQVKTARVGVVDHRYAHASVRVVVQQLLRQTFRLLAEDYVGVVGVYYVRVYVFGLC